MRWFKRKVPDFQTTLLFFLTVGFLINSMALYRQRHYPSVVVYNPVTNLAKLMASGRDGERLRELFLGGFRQATAIATGAWPFEMVTANRYGISGRLMEQRFAPAALTALMEMREEIALFQPFGTTELNFNSEPKITERQGGYFFEGFFNQTVPVGENEKRIRTFHVLGFGHLAPATQDNPYNIKFSDFRIKEIEPKTPRD